MSLSAQDPQNLRDLGKRLDDAQAKRVVRVSRPPPTQMSIAFRFATELGAAIAVGFAIGWGLDWLCHTRPLFIVVFFMLGAAAGLRNVMRAAKTINAEIAANPAPPAKDDPAPPAQDDEEN